jgi:hypothetical protein
MRLKLVIGTVHEKLFKDMTGERRECSKSAYPFMSFFKIGSVGGRKATFHSFLRITQTSQHTVCNANTSKSTVIRYIDLLRG